MPVQEAGLADPQTIALYEPVIGLEVHVQLKTRTKIFSHSTHEFGKSPNSQTDPVVLGLPGALPVLNREAVALAVRASMALNCKVNHYSQFARKNYFYPDLPKGYQISQYDRPLAENGWLDIRAEHDSKRIGITRLHMEEDAGKTIHDGFGDSNRYSYVDLNRAGAPLCEIVSEPDLRSAEEAVAYLNELKLVIQFAGASDCDMEKGQLRCDANVSVRKTGAEAFGTRCEIKNLNSFRFVKQAIQYEIARQVGVVEGGGNNHPRDPPVQHCHWDHGKHARQGRLARLQVFPRTRPAAADPVRRAARFDPRRNARTPARDARALRVRLRIVRLRRAGLDTDRRGGPLLRAGRRGSGTTPKRPRIGCRAS